jgi:hypothetical protein
MAVKEKTIFGIQVKATKNIGYLEPRERKALYLEKQKTEGVYQMIVWDKFNRKQDTKHFPRPIRVLHVYKARGSIIEKELIGDNLWTVAQELIKDKGLI